MTIPRKQTIHERATDIANRMQRDRWNSTLYVTDWVGMWSVCCYRQWLDDYEEVVREMVDNQGGTDASVITELDRP